MTLFIQNLKVSDLFMYSFQINKYGQNIGIQLKQKSDKELNEYDKSRSIFCKTDLNVNIH